MTGTATPLDRNDPFYVAGHRGLVGSALVRHLRTRDFTNIVLRTSEQLDLRDRASTMEFFHATRPVNVVVAAARVGGILANATYPHEFLSDNLQIQVNVMDAALASGVERLLFLGSSCIYPRDAVQPIREDALLSGPLEPTNDAYAIAKIAGLLHVRAARRQYGKRWISAMPTNLYGPHDNFSTTSSHVLAALVRRYVEAVRSGQESVTNWGSGTPRREFIHVDDLARACLHLLEHYDGEQHVNVGWGRDVSIRELAEHVARLVGYTGETRWDTTKPDGTPRKVLDVDLISSLGWSPQITLDAGIASTVDWYRARAQAVSA